MPYAGQLLVAAGMAQISPVSIMPYSWYSILMVIMGILSIMTGFPKLKIKEGVSKMNRMDEGLAFYFNMKILHGMKREK